MISTTVTVSLESGLHARPASKFVQLANQFTSDIHIKKGERSVNAKSIMGILSLAITKGTEINLEAEGEDAVAAVAALKRYLQESGESSVATKGEI